MPPFPTWKGVFPALVTHFNADESLDIPALLKHVDALLAAGIDGLIVLGTVGENCSLTPDEKQKVLRATIDHVSGQVPVLSGVAECSTKMACRYAADAAKIGANGLMVLPAMVYAADDREALQHFRSVSHHSDLPIMIYNNPVSYKVDIRPELFAELADEPKFTSIKESSDDVRRITDLRNLYADRFSLFCGVDDLVLESLLLGVDGWVSGLVNAFPAENRLLWDLAKAGKWAEALEVYRWYTPLLHLDTHPKLVQYIKMAVRACGYGTDYTRTPRMMVQGEEKARIAQIIQRAIETRPVSPS